MNDSTFHTFETDELLNIVESENNNELSKKPIYITILLGIVFVVAMAVATSTFTGSFSLLRQSKLSSTDLTVIISNEYGISSQESFPYPWLEGNLFAETYKLNTFQIQSTSSGCIYDWSVSGISNEVSNFYFEGSSLNGQFTLELSTPGKYQLSINEYCSNELTNSYESLLYSKYVRRELSSLTDSDREEFLDAFSTLWKVKTPEGKLLYGDEYKSLWYFAIIHNDASSNPVCDQFHTGSAFSLNHMLLGSYLEQQMRLVNPRVSLHFMEYVNYYSSDEYDHSLSDIMLFGGHWSEIFTEKWFGSNDPYTGQILDGRWAGIELPYVTDEFVSNEGIDTSTPMFPMEASQWLIYTEGIAHMKSPYGLLRSPWNWSPAPYTLRYNNINQFNSYDKYKFNQVQSSQQYLDFYTGVSCDDYEVFVQNKVNNLPLYSALRGIEEDIHGKVHFSVGGAGGQKVVETAQTIQDKFGFNELDTIAIAQSSQRYFKTVFQMQPGYRADIFGPFPLVCSDAPWQNGVLTTEAAPGYAGGPTCTLHDYYTSSEDKLQSLMDAFFVDWTKSTPQYYTLTKINSLTFDQKVELMNLISGQFQFDGDMAGSGAAHDPIFWVVHESVEKLLQKVYFEGTLSDYVYNDGGSHCSGHTEKGVKQWLKGYYFQDKSISTDLLTNAEFAEYLNPLTDLYKDNVNYVYDHSDWESSVCGGAYTEWFDKSNSKIHIPKYHN